MNKAIFLFIALCLSLLSFGSYAQKLTFSYDASGNQTGRAWVCVGCPNPLAGQAPGHSPVYVDFNVIDKEKNSTVTRTIIASPNPLKEKLNLDWKAEEGIYVKNIRVFSVSGNITHNVSPRQKDSHKMLSFQRMPTGTYIVYVTFSDQKTESIKIIKH